MRERGVDDAVAASGIHGAAYGMMFLRLSELDEAVEVARLLAPKGHSPTTLAECVFERLPTRKRKEVLEHLGVWNGGSLWHAITTEKGRMRGTYRSYVAGMNVLSVVLNVAHGGYVEIEDAQ